MQTYTVAVTRPSGHTTYVQQQAPDGWTAKRWAAYDHGVDVDDTRCVAVA